MTSALASAGSPTIQNALKLPSGARYYRCALQVNPHHYAATFRGTAPAEDEDSYIRRMVEAAVANHIDVLGIADHNNVRSVDNFAAAARSMGIVVLPGFEASSSEGVHVVCLFPPETSQEVLGRHLGELGIKSLDPSSDLSTMTFSELLACVVRAGGVAIAAHVTEDKGLLHTLHGEARIQAWQDANLLAVQIPGSVSGLPTQYKAIVENSLPDYRRVPTRARDLAIAVINAKDVTRPEDLAIPEASTRIKMTEPSIEGLRQAFLDPDSRLRLASEEDPAVGAELVAMSWEGGFLGGCAIHFNENLNVLVGGRGTGKSTIIESIRFALDAEPLGDDSKKAHLGIVRDVLRAGTKVSLLVRTRDPADRTYVIERTAPNPPVVRDGAGSLSALSPTEILKAEIYGQHEISELTKYKDLQTRLLHRFLDADMAASGRKGEIRRALEKSRRQILGVAKELADAKERLATLPALEETLKRYEDAGVEKRLRDQTLLVREERVLQAADERLGRLKEPLGQVRRDVPIDLTFLSPKALDDLPAKEILAEAREVLTVLSKEAGAALGGIDAALSRAEGELAGVRTKWGERKRKAQAEYEQILRELQRANVDGSQFVQLRRSLEELRPLADRVKALERDLKVLEEERRALLAEWEEAKAAEYRRLERAAKKIGKKLDGRVQVAVNFAGSLQPLFQLLERKPGGNLAAAKKTLQARPQMSVAELAAACRAGKDEVAKKFGLSPATAERVVQVGPELPLEIEELELPTTTDIQLNVAPEGQPAEWRTLEQLSTGQKATALLLIVLLESEGPLIVDQPEDDLDNRFIYEGVVPRMREEKRCRQFVLATHNANIPVLGDAELIVGLQASAGQARMESRLMGSIDAKPVRELVEDLLEGGKHAFELRREKYGY